MERKYVEGTLEKLVHKYKRREFFYSKIYIKEDKTGHQEEFEFYGLVPEFLIGKKINYLQEYFGGGFVQSINYKENSSEYTLINDE